MVPDKIFEKHKVYFCELILKFKDERRFKDYELEITDEQSDDLRVLKEVMTSMPNVKNLQSFFSHEVIQSLWMGVWQNPQHQKVKRRAPFKDHKDLQDHLKEISSIDRDKIYFFCSKLSPDVYNILP